MKIFKLSQLNDIEFFLSNAFNYQENKYNMKCFLKKQDFSNRVIIQTPKLQLESNINSGYLVMTKYNNKKYNKLLQFINKLETHVGNHIKNKFKKKLQLYSNFIDNDKLIINIKDKNIPIFNKNNNLINYSDVNIYSNIICILELNHVWVDLNNKKFGLNWNVNQIKVYPELNYNICYIDDSDDETDNCKKIINEFTVQNCLFCNSQVYIS